MRNRRGFTLIELLVALVLTGIVATALFQALLSQGRFARYIGAREEVQQNARVAVELISSELRTAVPGGITVAERNRLRFHLPRAWGVLCTAIPRGDVSQTIGVRFPTATFPTGLTLSNARWGLAVAQTADPTVYPAAGEWRFVTSVAAATPAPSCAGLEAAGNTVDLGFTGTGFVPSTSAAAQVPPGAFVTFFEDVVYDIGTNGADNTQWIRRSISYTAGVANLQPMAGPLPAADGVVFRYYDAAGTELLPGALTTQAQRNAIATVQVHVTTNSTARFGNAEPQVNRDSVRVTFRNL